MSDCLRRRFSDHGSEGMEWFDDNVRWELLVGRDVAVVAVAVAMP